jgi:hypothetical protein
MRTDCAALTRWMQHRVWDFCRILSKPTGRHQTRPGRLAMDYEHSRRRDDQFVVGKRWLLRPRSGYGRYCTYGYQE